MGISDVHMTVHASGTDGSYEKVKEVLAAIEEARERVKELQEELSKLIVSVDFPD